MAPRRGGWAPEAAQTAVWAVQQTAGPVWGPVPVQGEPGAGREQAASWMQGGAEDADVARKGAEVRHREAYRHRWVQIGGH